MIGKTMIRKLIRGCSWAIAFLVVAAAALVLADSLHGRTCPGIPLQGRVVQVPGERMEFLESESGTDGRVLRLDVVRDPYDDPDYELRAEHGHIHPYQAERFKIVEGSARFLIGDREVELTAGQSAVVPRNTVHHWMALDGQPVRVVAEFDPALDTGEWFLSFHGHLEQGDMDLLRAAVISSEFSQGSPLPADPSPVLWKVLVKTLAPVGRLLGYHAC